MYKVKGSRRGVVFCIHGNSSSSNIYRELMSSTEILYSKISVDLLGHGKKQSSTYTCNDISIDAQKKYLISVLSNIDEPILLIGHSLGGHFAIDIASKVKSIIGLVLIGTPPLKKPLNFEEAFNSTPSLNIFLEGRPDQSKIEESVKSLLYRKDAAYLIINDYNNTNTNFRTCTNKDVVAGKLPDEFTIFSNLKIQRFIIAGDQDVVINRDYLEYVKNSCMGYCEIIDLENCGHYPQIDKSLEFVSSINYITQKVFIS